MLLVLVKGSKQSKYFNNYNYSCIIADKFDSDICYVSQTFFGFECAETEQGIVTEINSLNFFFIGIHNEYIVCEHKIVMTRLSDDGKYLTKECMNEATMPIESQFEMR